MVEISHGCTRSRSAGKVCSLRAGTARLLRMATAPYNAERPAEQIRRHLQRVFALRQQAGTAGSVDAVRTIKRLQAQRFRSTYADFLAQPSSAPAVRFFLEELYGEHDFTRRDMQFERIAVALERMFPPAVNQLAVDLTETHALTEMLDHHMAEHWQQLDEGLKPAERYVLSWRLCASRGDRLRQLTVVQHMGRELQRITRMKSLRLALRMMRNPAKLAGLDALQHFLESGFDSFASLGDAGPFITAIQTRESRWIDELFDSDIDLCVARLQAELDRAVSA